MMSLVNPLRVKPTGRTPETLPDDPTFSTSWFLFHHKNMKQVSGIDRIKKGNKWEYFGALQ